jgi:hypothetical protein
LNLAFVSAINAAEPMTESVPNSLRPKAGRPEIDDVGAVVLRAVDHDLVIFGDGHKGRMPTPRPLDVNRPYVWTAVVEEERTYIDKRAF